MKTSDEHWMDIEQALHGGDELKLIENRDAEWHHLVAEAEARGFDSGWEKGVRDAVVAFAAFKAEAEARGREAGLREAAEIAATQYMETKRDLTDGLMAAIEALVGKPGGK